MKCTCWKEMKNLWNISCIVYASNPPQWDDVYICEECKTKHSVRVHWKMTEKINLDNYFNI